MLGLGNFPGILAHDILATSWASTFIRFSIIDAFHYRFSLPSSQHATSYIFIFFSFHSIVYAHEYYTYVFRKFQIHLFTGWSDTVYQITRGTLNEKISDCLSRDTRILEAIFFFIKLTLTFNSKEINRNKVSNRCTY